MLIQELIMMANMTGLLDDMCTGVMLFIISLRDPPTRYKDLPRLNIDNIDDDDCWTFLGSTEQTCTDCSVRLEYLTTWCSTTMFMKQE